MYTQTPNIAKNTYNIYYKQYIYIYISCKIRQHNYHNIDIVNRAIIEHSIIQPNYNTFIKGSPCSHLMYLSALNAGEGWINLCSLVFRNLKATM